MTHTIWRYLASAPDVPSAQALVGSLKANGVASQVVSDSALLGEGRPCRVFVEARQLHRAQSLLEQGRFSEEELALLATGSSPPDESQL